MVANFYSEIAIKIAVFRGRQYAPPPIYASVSFTPKIHYHSNSNIIEYCHGKVRADNKNKNRTADLQHLV